MFTDGHELVTGFAHAARVRRRRAIPPCHRAASRPEIIGPSDKEGGRPPLRRTAIRREGRVTMGERAAAAPRCAAIVGPYLSGKTSLLESLLHAAEAIPRKGTIKERNTVGDASPESRG